MSLADPQSITISGSTISLPRVSTGNKQSEYLSSDGLTGLKLASSYGNRTRQTVRLDLKKVSADVYLPSQNVERSMSCYLVFDRPVQGYTNADALAAFVGFNTLVTASTNAVITKLLGGES